MARADRRRKRIGYRPAWREWWCVPERRGRRADAWPEYAVMALILDASFDSLDAEAMSVLLGRCLAPSRTPTTPPSPATRSA